MPLSQSPSLLHQAAPTPTSAPSPPLHAIAPPSLPPLLPWCLVLVVLQSHRLLEIDFSVSPDFDRFAALPCPVVTFLLLATSPIQLRQPGNPTHRPSCTTIQEGGAPSSWRLWRWAPRGRRRSPCCLCCRSVRATHHGRWELNCYSGCIAGV
jgi:hypothetical protein